MNNYPDYRQSQTGYEKESKTIDQDTIIESQLDTIEKLRANLIRYEGVISNLKAENEKLKEKCFELAHNPSRKLELDQFGNLCQRYRRRFMQELEEVEE